MNRAVSTRQSVHQRIPFSENAVRVAGVEGRAVVHPVRPLAENAAAVMRDRSPVEIVVAGRPSCAMDRDVYRCTGLSRDWQLADCDHVAACVGSRGVGIEDHILVPLHSTGG